MKLLRIKSLVDNYIWILTNKKNTVIIDPGDFHTTDIEIQKYRLNPIAILLTHKHNDHILGTNKLKNKYKKIKIFGPKEIQKIKNIIIIKNNILKFNNFKFQILFTPGHTHEHVSYYIKPYLFCGDVLFSGGCGKIFEGTSKQMYNSINLIKNLPNKTLLCPGHEYTIENLKFANSIIKNDKKIKKYIKIINKKIKQKNCTPISTLKTEKNINIFLRCNDLQIKNKLHLKNNTSEELIFSIIRKIKDNFK